MKETFQPSFCVGSRYVLVYVNCKARCQVAQLEVKWWKEKPDVTFDKQNFQSTNCRRWCGRQSTWDIYWLIFVRQKKPETSFSPLIHPFSKLFNAAALHHSTARSAGRPEAAAYGGNLSFLWALVWRSEGQQTEQCLLCLRDGLQPLGEATL